MPAKPTRGKTRKGHISGMALAAVNAWAGNDTEACRAAGYRHPAKMATQIFSNPEVQRLIEEKKLAMARESGRQLGKSLTKTDAIGRALKLADTEVKKTRGNITGQVAALRLASELAGLIIKKTEDMGKQLEGKTEEQKEFFAQHGYWPESSTPPSGKPN